MATAFERGGATSVIALGLGGRQVQHRLCWIVFACTSVLTHAVPQDVELIPRKAYFGDPVRAGLAVSPDGKYLAWLAPRDGVMNVWVAPVARPHRGKPITAETVAPIRGYLWAPGSDRVLHHQYDANRKTHSLVGQRLAGGKAVIYASSSETPPRIIGASPLVRDSILVGLSDRNPQFPDAYRLNLSTGDLTLVRQNEGGMEWLVDMHLNVRGGMKHDGAGGFDIYRFDGQQTVLLAHIAPEDAFFRRRLAFDASGNTLYRLSTEGQDTRALVATNFASGVSEVIGTHGRADVVSFITHSATGKPEAYFAEYLRGEWTPVGELLEADLALLANRVAFGYAILSQSDDNRLWTLRANDLGARYYLYDRRHRSLRHLFSGSPALAGRTTAPVSPVEIRSRDGLTLTAFLTLPPGSDRAGRGRPDRPLPLILSVSDHVWGRVGLGPHRRPQWLANRGYAVLEVNQRGALGFGKTFHGAGDREVGGKRVDDVIDAVNWALRETIASAEEVAIVGMNYGGHVAMMALATAPEAFACGVNLRGATSHLRVIESPRDPFLTTLFRLKVGDPRTEEGRRKLQTESAIGRIGNLRRPLLITFANRSPILDQGEFGEIVAALQAKDIPVTYAQFADAGDGDMRTENRLSEYALVEAFLSRCLGGRYQPFGDDLRGSSIGIKAGADHVPGLTDTLGARKH